MTMSASDVARHRKEQTKKKGGKHDWTKIEPDVTAYLRIGPPWKKEGEVWKDVYFHGGWKNKVYCAKNDIDEDTGKTRKCLVCRRVQELKTDRSKRGKKLWSLINQRSEGLWNVLVVKRYEKVSGSKIKVKKYEDKKFKILRLSAKWHNLLLDIFSDEDFRAKSILGVTDPKYGRIIKVKRSGEGRDDTNYVFTALRSGPISEDDHVRHKLQATLNNLDKVAHGSSREELEAFLHRAEKKAKKLAKGGSASGSDSASGSGSASSSDSDDSHHGKKSSSSASASGGSSSASGSASASSSGSASGSASSSGSDDDLKRQYRKMKEKAKSKKGRHHHHGHKEESSS